MEGGDPSTEVKRLVFQPYSHHELASLDHRFLMAKRKHLASFKCLTIYDACECHRTGGARRCGHSTPCRQPRGSEACWSCLGAGGAGRTVGKGSKGESGSDFPQLIPALSLPSLNCPVF